MPVRTTLVLLVAAVSLTVYAVVFEAEVRHGFAPAGRFFSDLEPSDIVRLEIEFGKREGEGTVDAKSILLERRGEHEWWMLRPIEFPGLLPRIQGLTWTIADLVQVATVAPGTEAYRNAFPEGKPSLTVRFRTRQGGERTIEVGRDYPQPDMDYVYVRIDGTDVQVTRKDFRRAFQVGVDDLRSRALFPIHPMDATRLSIQGGGAAEKGFTRRSGSGEWIFDSPPELEGMLVDPQLMEDLLLGLNAWTVLEFVADAPEDLAAYGLDHPQLRIAGNHQNGTETVIEVGREFALGEDDLVYLRHSDRPFVFSADAEPLSRVRLEPERLRTRYVFDFRGAEAAKVACKAPEGGLVLERRKARESDGSEIPGRDRWVVMPPGGDAEYDADPHMAGVALAELRQLVIQSFLPPVPPNERSKFDRSIAVTLTSGEELALWIGPRSEDPRDKEFEVYHALRSTDRSHFLIETDWVRHIADGVYAFRDRALSELDPSKVREMEIAQGEASWRIGRPARDWIPSGAETLLPGKSLDSGLVNDLLLRLGRDRFRVEGFAHTLPEEDYDAWGIGQRSYRLKLRLTFVEGDETGFRELLVGHRKTGSDPPVYYARLDSEPVPLLVPSPIVAKLEELVGHLRDATGK